MEIFKCISQKFANTFQWMHRETQNLLSTVSLCNQWVQYNKDAPTYMNQIHDYFWPTVPARTVLQSHSLSRSPLGIKLVSIADLPYPQGEPVPANSMFQAPPYLAPPLLSSSSASSATRSTRATKKPPVSCWCGSRRILQWYEILVTSPSILEFNSIST